MRVLLFDWLSGGHHEIHVRRVAEALSPEAAVVAAVPDASAAALRDAPAEILSLGERLPDVDTSRYLSLSTRPIARAEGELLRGAVRRVRPDHAFVLYADGVVRALARGLVTETSVSLSVFRPRAHYPMAYGAPQAPRERLAALAFERSLAAWRRRPEAHALFSLDPEAVRIWSGRPGAPAHWLPEPLLQVERPAVEPARKSGCAVFGAIGPRKGIEALTRALEAPGPAVDVVIAGAVEPGYERELQAAAARMRAGGGRVEVRSGWQDDRDAVSLLAGARCAVLPYARHYGMSGVLAEACAVGTPVIVHDWGLLAHVVREHDLGVAVDTADPAALRAAIARYTEDAAAVERHAASLARFAAQFSHERFREAVRAPFVGGA